MTHNTNAEQKQWAELRLTPGPMTTLHCSACLRISGPQCKPNWWWRLWQWVLLGWWWEDRP